MSQTDTVSLSSVTFSYQGKPIIDDFNLSIQKGTVVAKSGNLTNITKNATTHCEINCIRDMFKKCGNDNTKLLEFTRNLTLYVTCEPCLMCAHALNQI